MRPSAASATDWSVANCIVPTGLAPYINEANPNHSFRLDGEARLAQPVSGGVASIGIAPDGTIVTGCTCANHAYQAAFAAEDEQDLDRGVSGLS